MLQKTFNILLYVFIYLSIAVLATTLYMFGGVLDGRINPAVVQAEITSTRLINNKVVFYGKSAILRPDCNFIRLDWYLGTRDSRYVPIKVSFSKSIVRPDGTFSFGPWVVDSESKDSFLDYTFANAIHKCHTFGLENPWETVSVFWN